MPMIKITCKITMHLKQALRHFSGKEKVYKILIIKKLEIDLVMEALNTGFRVQDGVYLEI